MFTLFYMTETKTCAAGGMLGDKYCNYEINEISLSGDYIVVKGWMYRAYEHYRTNAQSYYVKVHSGSNYINTYWDQNDYWVDHTQLQWAINGTNYDYADIGFHFRIQKIY